MGKLKMCKRKVTVAIPTFNREEFLARSMASVLSQTYKNLELLIIDNASTDNTEQIIRSFSDARIRYFKNEINVGIVNNWNRAVELCIGDYLLILGDDDRLHPLFVESLVSILNTYPSVGLVFTHCNKVDLDGNVIRLWGYNFPPSGLIKGIDYIKLTLSHLCCLTNSSTALMRSQVFCDVGTFNTEYCKNTFDFNMWLRIARKYDIYFLDRILVDYTIHSGQVSELHWSTERHPTGQLGTLIELLGLVSNLLESGMISKYNLQYFIGERLQTISHKMTELLSEEYPAI